MEKFAESACPHLSKAFLPNLILNMKILAIETSCDDTAAAVLLDGSTILANLVSSQDSVHGPFGGVVPELASRQHVRHILPILDGALKEAGIQLDDLDGIAVSTGSACSSGTLEPSHVLKAMGFPPHRTQNSIRFSLGAASTEADVDRVIASWLLCRA